MLKTIAASLALLTLCVGCTPDRRPARGDEPAPIRNALFAAPQSSRSKGCGASIDPEKGMIAISKPAEWKQIEVSGYKHAAFVTQVTGENDAKEFFEVTIVVTSLGEGEASPGIKPPVREGDAGYKSGVKLCHFIGAETENGCRPEIVRLDHGNMYIATTKVERAKDSNILPWPFIIRTPTVPAGPRASNFVMCTNTDSAGSLIREHVYRPKQGDANCNNVAQADTLKKSVVVTKAGGSPIVLKSVSGFALDKSGYSLETVDSGSDDERYLIDMCKFSAEAIVAYRRGDGKVVDLNCEARR